jgi:uroporphyrinogen decarboxylase
VRRFGFDAAILFSDILVIPEAMGQTYRFRNRWRADGLRHYQQGGHRETFRCTVCDKLSYVDKALRMLRKELGDQTALIGFTGSPWTLATFDGRCERAKYSRALALFREDPKTYFALAEKLTVAVTAYLKMQIATGVDAVQIFDSHGGHLAASEFGEASGRWMRDIVSQIQELSAKTPTIVFSLGTHGNWPDLIATGANVSASIGKPPWLTPGGSFPQALVCREISRPHCWSRQRRMSLRRKLASCSKPCVAGWVIFLTSATV